MSSQTFLTTDFTASPPGEVAVAPAPQRVEVRLCGPLTIRVDGQPRLEAVAGRRVPVLIAYLVANRGRTVLRDELIDVVWSGRPPRHPEAAFATVLSRARNALPPAMISGRASLALELGSAPLVDWETVLGARQAAADARTAGQPSVALEIAESAVALSRDGFLTGSEGEWVEERRTELGEARTRLLEETARAALAVGGDRTATAERAARELVAAEPLREAGHVLLMEALVAGGSPAEALLVYDRLRTLLREQLGVTPAAAVTALAERLLVEADSPTRGTRAAAAGTAPLPRAIATAAGRPFVGRLAELRRIDEIASTVERGERRVVVLAGEPGIGKTSLAASVAASVARRGWRVLYGRAEEIGPSYHAVFQALHDVARDLDPRVEARLGPELDVLRRRIPQLGGATTNSPSVPSVNPEVERYQLFEGIAALVATATVEQPALLILDDLHEADASTLSLLRHVVRATDGCSLLVLAIHRDGEDAMRAALRDTLDLLWRDNVLEQVAVEGLGRTETETLLAARGDATTPDVVSQLHDRTAGNPFYLEQLVRALAADGRLADDERADTLPQHVTTMVTWRIDRLAEPAPSLLRAGAVLGSSFDLATAATLAGCSMDEATRCAEVALRAGLVTVAPDEVDRYTFRHGLVQEALYGAIAPGRRARLHLAAGTALQRDDPRECVPAEVAAHFSRAVAVGGAEAAAHWQVEAAVLANRQYAHEVVAEHYRLAGVALDHVGASDDRRRADVLLGEGHARIRAGAAVEGRALLTQAAAVARDVGAPDLVADATLDACRACQYYGTSGELEPDVVESLTQVREHLARVGAADPSILARRALVAGLLAMALYFDPDGANRRRALADEASELAIASGDPSALANAVASRHAASWVTEDAARLLGEAEQMMDLALQAGDEELEAVARTWRLNHLLALGNSETLGPELDRFDALTSRLRPPRCSWYAPVFRALEALMQGRFVEAERLIATAADLGSRIPGSPAPLHAGAQVFALRWMQGRLEEIRPAVASLLEQYPAVVAWRCGMAQIEAEVGNVEAARGLVDEIAPDRFALVPRDSLWLGAMTALSDTCASVSATEHAATLLDLLGPHADLCAVTPTSVWMGPVHRVLGRLHGTLEQWDDAIEHLDQAAALCERVGSPPLLAMTDLDRAVVLRGRGRGGDLDASRTRARSALAAGSRLGMHAVVERALRYT